MDPAKRIAFHEISLVVRNAGDLVLADERVAADEVRGRYWATPSSRSCIGGVAPEGIVVAIGLSDVSERILIRSEIVRWSAVWTGDPDPLPHPFHAFISDLVSHSMIVVALVFILSETRTM